MNLAIALPFLVLGAVVSATEPSLSRPRDAAALLAAQRAGLGEPASLAALGNVRSRGRIAFEGFPGEGTFTSLNAPTGAARQEAVFEGTPPAVRCTNGQLFWMIGSGGVEIKKGWSAAADVRFFGCGRHRDWREMYQSAEIVGETRIGTRTCDELRLVPKSPAQLGIEAVVGEESPAPDTWWLDRDSKELVRIAIYATVSGAGWQRIVLENDDWRPVAGVRFPHRCRMTFGPAEHPIVIVLETASLETNVDLPPDAFQPDERVFVEIAKAKSGDAAKDPGFALQTRKKQLTATVRVKCKPDQIQQQLAIILPEVMGYLKREQLTPVGAPFARYHATGAEIDLEAGIPVAESVAGNDRIRASSLPGGEVVAGTHVGPYRELPRTYEALARWLAQHELTAEGGPWEIYWTDPGLQRDPSKWRTEILQAVALRANAGSDSATKGSTPKRDAPKSGKASAAGSALARLEQLVGTWKVTSGPGGPEGVVTFEWLEGGHFLVQRVDLVQGSMHIKGIELIGCEKKFGAESASADVTSRFYDNTGNTLDYAWEAGDGTITIWGGQKGSPMSYQGTFSADGNVLTGGWKWPGGGFDSTSTRIGGAKTAQLDARASK